jgi:hypothetical protein
VTPRIGTVEQEFVAGGDAEVPGTGRAGEYAEGGDAV